MGRGTGLSAEGRPVPRRQRGCRRDGGWETTPPWRKRCPRSSRPAPRPGHRVCGRTEVAAAHAVACGRGHVVVAELRPPGRSWSMPRQIGGRQGPTGAEIPLTAWWAASRSVCTRRVPNCTSQYASQLPWPGGSRTRVGVRSPDPDGSVSTATVRRARPFLRRFRPRPRRAGDTLDPPSPAPAGGGAGQRHTRTGSSVRRSGVPPGRNFLVRQDDMIDAAARRGLDRSRPSEHSRLETCPAPPLPCARSAKPRRYRPNSPWQSAWRVAPPGGHTATVHAAAHFPNMDNPSRFSAEPISFLEIE